MKRIGMMLLAPALLLSLRLRLRRLAPSSSQHARAAMAAPVAASRCR